MSKFVVVASWLDSPHITPSMRSELINSIPPYQRKARSEGIPYLGEGLVYPVPEDDIKIPDFNLPLTFKRCFALDTSWNRNAVVWAAWDEQADVVYIYRTLKRGGVEPPIIAAAIQAAGAWIPGVADAADISRVDGKMYFEIYRALGLDIELPDKALETGISLMWTALSTGRLRVFESCTDWFDEFRVYSRNIKGIIERQTDDCLDATRYILTSGLQRAKLPPTKKTFKVDGMEYARSSWMG